MQGLELFSRETRIQVGSAEKVGGVSLAKGVVAIQEPGSINRSEFCVQKMAWDHATCKMFPKTLRKKINLHSRHTCGQLLMGTHCFFRHSVLPFTQAQMVQLTEDHISPSYRREHRILLSAGG